MGGAKDTKGNVLAVHFTEIISTLECFGYTDEWVHRRRNKFESGGGG